MTKEEGKERKGMTHAEIEFEILENLKDNFIILEFKEEVLALVDKFRESGQSGGSAPMTAKCIADAVKKLCLFEPISTIEKNDQYWEKIASPALNEDNEERVLYQNTRLTSLFKYAEDELPHYLYSIIWRDENGSCFTTSIYEDIIDFKLISSSQTIKYPFTPKSFYIDVIGVPHSELITIFAERIE